jgi:purine nucleosidase
VGVRSIWLDTDAGFDDWMTMLMLSSHPELRWLGVGVVAGNASLQVALANTLRICHHYRLNVPVFAGCDRPMTAPLETAERVLGAQGMRTTGLHLPDVQVAAEGLNAVAALGNALRNSAVPVTVLAIGPLTNIARTLQAEPALVDRIDELVLMGGSTERGNHTPAAEFNIYVDPEAADFVFNQAGLRRRMFGLNVCRQVLLERAHVQMVQRWPGERARWLAGYLDAYQRIRHSDGAAPMPLYDPVTSAWILRPELFTFQSARVDVELEGRFTRGMTVCDLRAGQNALPNAEIAMSADGPRVVDVVLEAVRKSL